MHEEHRQKLIEKFKLDIIRLNNQRIRWLTFSSLIFTVVILIIFLSEKINDLHSHTIWWVIGSLGLLLSINWWYWTLTLIRRVLQHQIDTVIILSEITNDVKEIKTDINDLYQKGLIE
jgi:hypothetical protein